MPEVSQYTFTLQEVAEALVKKAGLHEGVWQVLFNFNLGAGNFGAEENVALPGAIATISGLGLLKAEPKSPPNLVVDASVVNPPEKKTKRTAN